MAAPRAARFPYGPDDILAPTKYRLIRRLGRGGFAEVWEAQNSFMDRIDAIKIILPQFAESGTYTAQKIAKEARIPNALRQRTPHVADVLDAGITELGLPYIVMELLKGNTLREHIAKRAREQRPIELKNIVGIACDILHALSIAHKQRIVHLDVKPENIFLAKQFDQGVETTMAKLLDFGLAMLFEKQTTGASEDGLAGTPRYAAPEQFSRDYGMIGTWTDTYAVGHVLFELVVGNPTFEPTGVPLDRQALEDAQLTREPPDVREFRADVPPPLAAMIRRCLRKRTSERPQSASEIVVVLAALDEALRGKRSLVSLAAISDFDLPLDALKFDTTQPSPAPTLALPEPESAQLVQGPTYVSPHSTTEIPDVSHSTPNASESYATEPPIRSTPTIFADPVVFIGSGTQPLARKPSEPLPTTQPLRLQVPPSTPITSVASDAPAAEALVARAPPRDDKTDPDGPPLFLDEPPLAKAEAPPRAAPSATALPMEDVFRASPLEEQAPARNRTLPRYPVQPGSGPMTNRPASNASNASLRPVAQRTIATEDRAPVVPLVRHAWLAPTRVFAVVFVLGAAIAFAMISSRAPVTAPATTPASAPVQITAPAPSVAAPSPETSAPSSSAPIAMPSPSPSASSVRSVAPSAVRVSPMTTASTIARPPPPLPAVNDFKPDMRLPSDQP